MLSDARDLMWFFSEGQAVAERSPFGAQLRLAETYAAPLAARDMRAGTCTRCEGDGRLGTDICPACEGDGRSNPVYLSTEDHTTHGMLGDDTALLRYARISRRLLAMRPRHLSTVLCAVYGAAGDHWGRKMRGRRWAVMSLTDAGAHRTPGEWDHLAQLEALGSEPERARELARAGKEAAHLVECAEDEWRATQ